MTFWGKRGIINIAIWANFMGASLIQCPDKGGIHIQKPSRLFLWGRGFSFTNQSPFWWGTNSVQPSNISRLSPFQHFVKGQKLCSRISPTFVFSSPKWRSKLSAKFWALCFSSACDSVSTVDHQRLLASKGHKNNHPKKEKTRGIDTYQTFCWEKHAKQLVS